MIQAIFERKPDFRLRETEITKVIRLPAKEYEQFLRRPCVDYAFIEKHSELMYMDGKSGVYHSLLVTGEGHRDGVLVESEGSSYARYASFVPDVTLLEYPSLSKFVGLLSQVVHGMVAEGAEETTEGNWITSFVEIEEQSGLEVSGSLFLQELLADMMAERPEVAHVDIGEDHFAVYYYLNFCPNYEVKPQEETEDDTAPVKVMDESGCVRLRDLLFSCWENVHLIHEEIENEPHTIVELDTGTLTEAGKRAWADVLNAKVERVYQGFYGLQMDLSGVKPSRLDAFSAMLGGYCSVQEYETWVNEPEEEPVSPQLKNT
ncbi:MULTISPECIES: DUF6329 domain-containing protein [Hungatella]|uniref:DUF6329 domain-containing protein n=1 Tax=Hungatella TaxID=1649459 RepID=UPI001FAA318C|nr:DUF6329 domain-containing protein [Hungatella hathewayi]